MEPATEDRDGGGELSAITALILIWLLRLHLVNGPSVDSTGVAGDFGLGAELEDHVLRAAILEHWAVIDRTRITDVAFVMRSVLLLRARFLDGLLVGLRHGRLPPASAMAMMLQSWSYRATGTTMGEMPDG